MARGLHGLEFFEPLLDREFFFVVVIFGEEVAVLTTQIAAVGNVDRTDGILRQTEDEEFGDVAEFTQLSTDVH